MTQTKTALWGKRWIRRPISISYIPILWTLLNVLVVWCIPDTTFAKTGDAKKASASEKITQKKVRNKHDAKKRKAVSPGVQAKAFYCVNPAKNETVMQRNPDQSLPVASLTKLATALVVVDKMALDAKVTVPDHIKTVPRSVVGLKPGDSVTVDDLLHGLLIGSGNDCAEALACAFPGGRHKFIECMNKRVRTLGNHRTFFYTPSGLDSKTPNDPESKKTEEVASNVSTAREMAKIAKEAFANKTIRTICLKKSHVIASTVHPNGYYVRTTNKLLRDNLPLVGGKTGFTVRAGHCLASEFKPGRDVFLIVVLGSPDHFRDTRLVYQSALKKTKTTKSPTPAPESNKVAAN